MDVNLGNSKDGIELKEIKITGDIPIIYLIVFFLDETGLINRAIETNSCSIFESNHLKGKS